MVDHYKLRYFIKLYAFVIFGLLSLSVVVSNCLYTFLHYDPKKPQDLGWSISMAGIYLGVFKYFIPSKAEAGYSSTLSEASNSRPPSPQRNMMHTLDV